MKRGYFSLISAGWLLLALPLSAQDVLFSQYRISPWQVNPAEVSASSDWRAVAHYRSQRMAGDVGFRSTQFSVARPLFWGKRRYAGVGLSILDDRSGEVGWFRFQRVGLSLAHDVPVTGRQRISLGLQAHYQAKRITTEGVRTGSQFRPGQGFDPTLLSGEGTNGLQTSYFSLNAGLLWYATDQYDRQAAYLGLSTTNLNQPDDGFLATSSVPMGLQAHGGLRLLERGRTTVLPELLWVYRTGGHLLNVGSRISYRLGSVYDQSPTVPRLELIPRYTVNRSASLAVQWQSASYTFGVSYDTDASFAAAQNPLRSTFELAIAWRHPVPPKTRPRRRRKHRGREPSATKLRVRRVVPQPWAVMTDPEKSPTVEVTEVSDRLAHLGLLVVQRLTLTAEFAFGRAVLSPTAKATLRAIARFLKQQPNLTATLTGHADGVGAATANQRLSEERALTVRDFLVVQGVAAERLQVVGRGAEEPLYPNTSEILRAKNRRVAIGLGAAKE